VEKNVITVIKNSAKKERKPLSAGQPTNGTNLTSTRSAVIARRTPLARVMGRPGRTIFGFFLCLCFFFPFLFFFLNHFYDFEFYSGLKNVQIFLKKIRFQKFLKILNCVHILKFVMFSKFVLILKFVLIQNLY
jgi:hypothetical protein